MSPFKLPSFQDFRPLCRGCSFATPWCRSYRSLQGTRPSVPHSRGVCFFSSVPPHSLPILHKVKYELLRCSTCMFSLSLLLLSMESISCVDPETQNRTFSFVWNIPLEVVFSPSVCFFLVCVCVSLSVSVYPCHSVCLSVRSIPVERISFCWNLLPPAVHASGHAHRSSILLQLTHLWWSCWTPLNPC